MIISSLILLVFSLVLYYFIVVLPSGEYVGIYPLNLTFYSFIFFFFILFMQLILMFLFIKIIPKKHLYEKAIKDIAFNHCLAFLFLIFLINALAEELIFRVIIQENYGILVSSILFAAAHIAYYKKIFLLIEVFLQGLLLGFLYELTSSLLLCTLSHTVFNFITVYLIKRKILIY